MGTFELRDIGALPPSQFIHIFSVSGSPTDLDPAPAWMLGRNICYQYDIFPFAIQDGALCVASLHGELPSHGLFDSVRSVRWFQSSQEDLHRAQLHVFGSPRHTALPFGEIAMNLGILDASQIAEALAEQQGRGGLLGQICLMKNWLTGWNIAQILSEQTTIPVMNILDGHPPIVPPQALSGVWDLFTEQEWRNYGIIPVNVTEDAITVATADPFTREGRLRLSMSTTKSVRTVLTGDRDIEQTLVQRYGDQNLENSRDALRSSHPEDSADKTITRPQIYVAIALVALTIGFLLWHPVISMAALSSLLIMAYASLVAYRLWIIRNGTKADGSISADAETLRNMDEAALPIYTVLIPARDETSILPMLTQSLIRLDYPKDRLDVKLILEEDDLATIHAAYASHLPNFIDIVIVPVREPRTKPKACNFALQRARGEFVTIFDAEDAPEPTQLKKAVLAFQTGDPAMACVQAKLSYFNASQNLLTRWFTAEYAAWFDLFLPALHAARLPIPLGGTSNHFRTAVLRQLGAWDPFNVTEDADLGVRIFKAGYTTSVIDSVTFEEANSDFVNWIRQRSRWIKGYLQTWLVHMRHPRQLYKKLGGRGFWGFQMSILGTPLMFLLNPLYWFLTSLWFMTHWNLIPQMFPPGIYYLGMMNLLIGNFTFMYLNAIGAAKRGNWELIPYTLMIPIYWTMMSLASWKALLQLITRPFHWEKTEHGLTDMNKFAVEELTVNQ